MSTDRSTMFSANVPLAAVEVETAVPAQAAQSITERWVDRLRQDALTTEALKKIPPNKPLVPGLLYLDTLAVLFAKYGVGKSHVAVSLSAAVATGTPWLGCYPVTQGTVLYIVGEGVAGIGPRVDAWEQHHGATVDAVRWVPYAVNLFDNDQADALTEFAAELAPKLIVIDTLARCSLGAEENSGKDMGFIVDNLERLRTATGALVLVIHHTGKVAANGSRGHTALPGALETELLLEGDARHLTLRTLKQKNAVEGPPVHMHLAASGDSVTPALFHDMSDDDDNSYDGAAEIREAVLGVLDGAEPMSRTAISKELRGMNKGYRHENVVAALKVLSAAGLIGSTKVSGYPRWHLVEEVAA